MEEYDIIGFHQDLSTGHLFKTVQFPQGLKMLGSAFVLFSGKVASVIQKGKSGMLLILNCSLTPKHYNSYT